MVFIQTLALWFSNPAIAIVTTNACTKTVLHLYYNGRARRHAQGHNRSQSSMAVAKCLQCIALQHAKGRDGGKNNLSGNDKSSSLDWKVTSQRDFPKTFRGATQSLSPVRAHRATGRCHMSQRPLPTTRCARAQTKLLHYLFSIFEPTK